MRQAGVLAAAGIVALEKMIGRLGEDHERARRLARGLQGIPAVRLDAEMPPTNMVFFSYSEAVKLDEQAVAGRMAELGILVNPVGRRRFRLVTHYWIDDAAVNLAIEAFVGLLR